MPKVFITNKSPHNFEDAERFGDLVFLTSGEIDKYKVNVIYRTLAEQLEHSQPEDYLVVSSLSIMQNIASSILAVQHGVVNYLLFSRGKYIERQVDYRGL